MKIPTGQEIREAALRDPLLAGQPIMAPGNEELFDQLPEVFQNLLERPVNFVTLLECQVLFLRFAVESDMMKNYVDALELDPTAGKSDFTKAELLAELHNDLVEILLWDPNVTLSAQQYLQEQGLTDRHLILELGVARSPSLVEAYDAGTLTVADALTQEPGLVLAHRMPKREK